MDHLRILVTFGEMFLVFIGMVVVWYICHVVRPIAGYYLHFHITKWLGWHDEGTEYRDEQ